MTAEQVHTALTHLPAILIFIAWLLVYVFYAFLAVAGVVLAIDFVLELLHKLLNRMIGRAQ